MSDRRTLTVSDDDAGKRVDVWLVERVSSLSRARVRKMAASGGLLINGRPARKGRLLASGDRVEIVVPPPRDFLPPPSEVPLVVLYEDAHLVVVDKPPGMPSHPLGPEEMGTAVNALLARYPEMDGVGYRRREAGLVHRLDTGTSGALLAARDRGTFEALRACLEASEIDKRYRALVRGRPLEGTIEAYLATDPADRRRVRATVNEREAQSLRARLARTEVTICSESGEWTLIEAAVASAGRHQIRAHLAYAGHPLAGDELYGGPVVPGLERHFLHASAIAFEHPVSRARVRVDSPLAPDLETALAAC